MLMLQSVTLYLMIGLIYSVLILTYLEWEVNVLCVWFIYNF